MNTKDTLSAGMELPSCMLHKYLHLMVISACAAIVSAFKKSSNVLSQAGAVQRPMPPRHGGSVVGENVPVFDPPRKPVSTGSKRSYQDMDKVSNSAGCRRCHNQACLSTN